MNKAQAVELSDEIVLLLHQSGGGIPAPRLMDGVWDRLDQIRTAFPYTGYKCTEVEDTAAIYFSERAADYFDTKGAAIGQIARLKTALQDPFQAPEA